MKDSPSHVRDSGQPASDAQNRSTAVAIATSSCPSAAAAAANDADDDAAVFVEGSMSEELLFPCSAGDLGSVLGLAASGGVVHLSMQSMQVGPLEHMQLVARGDVFLNKTSIDRLLTDSGSRTVPQ